MWLHIPSSKSARGLRSHFSALLETISADEPLGGLFDVG